MYSERANDGIERSREQWFRRYNGKAPGRGGGARKSRAAKAGDWLDKTARRGREKRTGRWSGRAGGSGSITAAWPRGGRKRIGRETWSGRPS